MHVLCSPSLTVQQNRASNYAFREKVFLYLLLWTPSVRQVFCRKNPPLHSKWCVSCSQQKQQHFVWKQIQKELGTYNRRQYPTLPIRQRNSPKKSHSQNMVWMTSGPGKYSGENKAISSKDVSKRRKKKQDSCGLPLESTLCHDWREFKRSSLHVRIRSGIRKAAEMRYRKRRESAAVRSLGKPGLSWLRLVKK